jgi:enoyl-CoA hydratase
MQINFQHDEKLKKYTIAFDGDYLNRQNIIDMIKNIKRELSNKETNFFVFESHSDNFCLGHDIKELLSFDPAEAKVYASIGQELIKLIKDSKKVFISKLNGKIYGPALEIAIATDLIFALNDAIFAFPETEYGFLPAFGGTSLAARKIHENFVKFLTITSEEIGVSELVSRGIISKIFNNANEMKDYTEKLIKTLNEKSIFAMGLAKETINSGIELDIDKALLLEQNAFAVAFSSFDKKEGMTAFTEKRKPSFKNRWEDYDEIF